MPAGRSRRFQEKRQSSSAITPEAEETVPEKAVETETAAKEDETKNKDVTRTSLMTTAQTFLADHFALPLDEDAHRLRVAVKIYDEFRAVKDLPSTLLPTPAATAVSTVSAEVAAEDAAAQKADRKRKLNDSVAQMADASSLPEVTLIDPRTGSTPSAGSTSIVEYRKQTGVTQASRTHISQQLIVRGRQSDIATSMPMPEWHAPWKLFRVVSGHLGWVRSLAVDITNDWFASGSSDKTIKLWDLASGTLKLTLTGHIGTIRSLVVSQKHPYLFSCGDDKMIKCWDLESNKVVRNYHGHLSGVYSMALHPTIDVLLTGGRDSTVRVWDIRSRTQVMVLTGHNSTISSLVAQASDPQVISGSNDSTIRLWDLAAGRSITTLTHHKKSVVGMVMHPREFSFASVSTDNIKKWQLPEGKFMDNMATDGAIVNSIAISKENVLVSGADNGSMKFFDWASGYCFQQEQAVAQPGSLESENCVYSLAFDQTSSRLLTGEADKSIKFWKPDDSATPETHPIDFRPTKVRKHW